MCRYYHSIIGLLLFLTACKPGTPSEFIQPDEMEDILVEYHLSKAMANYTGGDSEKNWALYKAALLEKYGITEAELDSSLVYYYTRADRLEPIYKRVAERLEEQAVNLGASEGEIVKYSTLTANGDTADIWTQRETALLLPTPPYNLLEFNVLSDSTYRKGDSFLFQFMTDFVYQSGSRQAVALLSVTFDNDSVVTCHINVAVAGHNQLRIDPIDSCGIRSVKGFVYLSGASEQTTTVRMLFLHHIQLIRFHQNTQQMYEQESASQDSIEQDSVSGREDTDTVGHRDTVRNSMQMVPIDARDVPHRVVDRVHPAKIQPQR